MKSAVWYQAIRSAIQSRLGSDKEALAGLKSWLYTALQLRIWSESTRLAPLNVCSCHARYQPHLRAKGSLFLVMLSGSWECIASRTCNYISSPGGNNDLDYSQAMWSVSWRDLISRHTWRRDSNCFMKDGYGVGVASQLVARRYFVAKRAFSL